MKQLAQLDARMPGWDTSSLRERRCPFCGSDGVPAYRRPDTLTVRRCDECCTFFISPAPGPEQLDAFYARYNERHRRNNVLNDEATALLLARDPWSDIRVAEIASCFAATEGRRALDVGFGLGATLVLLRKLGFDVEGIELDDEAVGFVRTALGIDSVHRAAIGELEGAERCDAIVMHDLVEHPLDPLALLQRAVGLLRPGGVISIWTPNASFIDSEEEPVAFRVDLEHMQYLTLSTCAWLAQQLGVEIVHLESVGFPSLHGIDRQPQRPSAIKQIVKSLPGVLPWLTRRRLRAEQHAAQRLRRGRYHLHCLLRKPE